MSNFENQIQLKLWDLLWKNIDEGYYDPDELDWELTHYEDFDNSSISRSTRDWQVELVFGDNPLILIDFIGVHTLNQKIEGLQDKIAEHENEIEYCSEMIGIYEDEKYDLKHSTNPSKIPE